MRRYFIIVLAAFTAFLMVELIVAEVVNFPRRPRGRLVVVSDKCGWYNNLSWEQPYTRYFNAEGGVIITQSNNIGLPGLDIARTADSRYIFVLGSSFVEARQVPSERIATSLFQAELQRHYPCYQVLNLGLSGADSYRCWFRSRFFESQFDPSCVILVIERLWDIELRRYQRPLDFSLPLAFGMEARPSALLAALRLMREKSAFVNALSQAFSEDIVGPVRVDDGDRQIADGGVTRNERKVVSPELVTCLRAYKQRYGSRFVVVLMLPNEEEQDLLEETCRQLDIKTLCTIGIQRPENRFLGNGHLNETGNKKLGMALYDAFALFRENKDRRGQ